MTIKAIETRYKGYRFRSRLEARWAVFFDALGLQWEYEPEGFDLGEAGWYLPDFYLPELEAWAEIKPKNGNQNEVFRQLVGMLESGVAKPEKAWGFFGDPLNHEWMMPVWYDRWRPDGSAGWKNEWSGANVEFHKVDSHWEALTGFGLNFQKDPRLEAYPPEKMIANYPEKQKARAARFEHGECG